MNIERIERLAAVAAHYHRDQVDLSGKPYIDHPRRVASRLMALGIERIVIGGYFHDFVEDVVGALEVLGSLDLDEGERRLILSLTVGERPVGMSYDRFYLGVYIKALSQSPESALVKISDLLDNSDPARMVDLSKRSIRRIHKYKIALEYLVRSLEGAEFSLAKLRTSAPELAMEIEDRIEFLAGFCLAHSSEVEKSGYEKIRVEFDM